MKRYIEFIHFCESLKNELRNGRTSRGKKESVAEHSWRLAIMAMIFAPRLDKEISLERALKMALVHDLAEAVTGDNPYFLYENNCEMQFFKYEQEFSAMKIMHEKYRTSFSKEIIELWHEFESGASYEAKFIKALDKIEAQIQHNEAGFEIWNDFDIEFSRNGLDKYCQFDSFLTQIKNLVQEESRIKISLSTSEHVVADNDDAFESN
ncbi:MAG: HD domain-containing protein [Chlamydiales bacterium]|nr:HD domain-containing protein [Chlamydiales bacterium]